MLSGFKKKGYYLAFIYHLQAAGEVKALEDFYKMLQHEPDKAFYG